MGSRGFSTFVSNVERNIGNRTSLNTQVGEAVNQAHIDIITLKLPMPGGGFFQPIKFARALQTSGTITLAAGDQSFALTEVSGVSAAQDVFAIYGLRDDTNDKMLSGPEDFRSMHEKDVTVTGNPTKYSLYGNTIYLNLTTSASTAYTLYYYKRPATLSGSTTTDLPSEYDHPIELRATEIIFETPLQENDHAAEYRALIDKWFAERLHPESLANEDQDFGLVPTRSATSNTNRASFPSRRRR